MCALLFSLLVLRVGCGFSILVLRVGCGFSILVLRVGCGFSILVLRVGCVFFSFGFESWVWYLILLVPDHRLSFYYEILWNLAVDVEKVDLGYGGEGKRLEKKINTFIYYFENAYFGMSSEPIHRTAFVWIALLDGEPDRKMVFCAAMCQF